LTKKTVLALYRRFQNAQFSLINDELPTLFFTSYQINTTINGTGMTKPLAKF